MQCQQQVDLLLNYQHGLGLTFASMKKGAGFRLK